MFNNIEQFKAEYIKQCSDQFADRPEILKPIERYLALATMLSEEIRERWAKSRDEDREKKKVYYFSSEFLIGHLFSHNLEALQVTDIVREGLKELDISLDELLIQEKDAGLGNGGLGRLAACYMDSMTRLKIAGRGNGIRYRHGFFKQEIKNFEQAESAEHWLENGYPWETKRPGRSVIVKFGGNVKIEYIDNRLFFKHENYLPIKAVPYEVSILANDGEDHVNSLRLWDSEALEDFDFDAYNQGDFVKAICKDNEACNLTQLLYPNDNYPAGKRLRLMQEYFFVSAGITAIIQEYLEFYGNLDDVENKIAIHINDTHPSLCIPELMRVFLDDYKMTWTQAWNKTNKMVSYTNHTILPEALEKWSVDLMRSVQPRICMIIEELNRRFIESLLDKVDLNNDDYKNLAIIQDGQIHMAYLSVLGSHSVNGVARIHTEILKNNVLHAHYKIFPEKFNNKTNGISHRTFLLEANPELSSLISETIGNEWLFDTSLLENVLLYKNDASFIEKFSDIKKENKVILSKIIKDSTGYKVDPDSIFDIQVKRIHAYKRQLLNILGIMYRCNMDSQYFENMPNHTFIFAGKAAPSYDYAKSVIRLANRLAQKVNTDPVLSKKMKVIFLPNFNVSLAQKIYPAADISQQISTAGMEASGTGNMKFMMNGALTLGTMDGANVEIFDLVGKDNIKIFGMSVEDIEQLKKSSYNPWDVITKDIPLRRIIAQLQGGYFSGNAGQFNDIVDSLIKYGDSFYVLQDFKSYMEACRESEALYLDKENFTKLQIHNMAMSGYFSSDRAIREYAKDIWKV
ncbi:MAG: glycogen/starch/alpha-glucan phosphorylase [Clostridia bacterium]|nr:glycogen/starch/alpha-glucan phosphorylase [Clostridia bacterium]